MKPDAPGADTLTGACRKAPRPPVYRRRMGTGQHEAPTHAGGVVFRVRAETEYLLVTAKQNRAHWLYPKGHIEVGEAPEECAVREVKEESGVDATILRVLDDSVLVQPKGRQVIRFFLMRYESDEPAAEGREVAWLPLQAALDRLTFEDTRALLRVAAGFVPERRGG
jgi:8-oxo-dGTP pyrophosphatase MutT (NUDIX family)